jgi:NADPH-dependent curcumin reductase CurA
MNKKIVLNSRPTGMPVKGNFRMETIEMPVIKKGELLLKAVYVSVDPYLRGRMSDAKSYAPPFQLNAPIESGVVAEVVESQNAGFKKGDYVVGALAWQQYQTSTGIGLNKTDPSISPSSLYLGTLGMTGLTAYLGLTEIGAPKAGETLVVSGAAGAVGTMVGQIGKLLGCRVIGIAGTDEKITTLQTKFGFDVAINYKTTPNMKEAIAKACPNGVDIYFDNVGGEISDAVLANINKYARIALCGAISMYNATEAPIGPRLQPMLLKSSARMQGFIVSNFADKFPQAITQLGNWFKEGKITYSETIVEGFDNIPQAFIDLFAGKNEGKMIVKI